MQQLNWDNLRYVLMVAEKGSIAAAARELGVNRTTVLRRINALQENLNCRIFERGDSGYVLTPEAERMIAAAREMENTLFNMQRQIAGRELRLEGELRVTTTDTLMLAVLGEHLSSFHQKHPHIVVELLVTNNILDLNRRDADIAIRPTRAPEGNLVGRRVAEFDFHVYAAPTYMQATQGKRLAQHNWIGLDASLQNTAPAKWLASNIPNERFCLRADSFVTLMVAAEHGMGLALLPHYLGDVSPGLQQVPAATDDLTTGLWLVAHPDLARSAKVNAFIDHFGAALDKARAD